MTNPMMVFTKGIVTGVVVGTAVGAVVTGLSKPSRPIKKKAVKFVKGMGAIANGLTHVDLFK